MIISGVKFSKGIIDIFSTYNKDYANYFKNLKSCIHKLISIRNKILNTLKSINKLHEHHKIFDSVRKTDLLSNLIITSRFKNTKFIDPFNLWGVRKKTKAEDMYEGSELTDDNN